MNSKEKMINGLIYNPMEESILKEQFSYIKYVNKFNKLGPNKLKKRTLLAEKMFASFGNNSYIEPPIHTNFGGKHVHIGDNVYINYNISFVDDGNIYIGNNTLIGPNVTLVTALHPILPELRKKGLQYNKDIHIGNNVWISSNVIIFPGVSVGDNSVVGAGSVVTKDVPSNVVAFGSPCKVVRDINENDKIYYDKNKKIDWNEIK